MPRDASFGASKLPGMGRGMGEAIRGFKETVTGKDNDDGPHP